MRIEPRRLPLLLLSTLRFKIFRLDEPIDLKRRGKEGGRDAKGTIRF